MLLSQMNQGLSLGWALQSVAKRPAKPDPKQAAQGTWETRRGLLKEGFEICRLQCYSGNRMFHIAYHSINMLLHSAMSLVKKVDIDVRYMRFLARLQCCSGPRSLAGSLAAIRFVCKSKRHVYKADSNHDRCRGCRTFSFHCLTVGLLFTLAGSAVAANVSTGLERIIGFIVIGLGAYYLFKGWSKYRRHHDNHIAEDHHGHCHSHVATGSTCRLGIILGARPCVEAIPIFLASTRGYFHRWQQSELGCWLPC